VEADHGETTLEVVCHREEVYYEFRTGAGRKDPEKMQKIKLFPTRKCLVSDMPAGEGKNDNIFYSVNMLFKSSYLSLVS
jgi:hypothetical protein